MLSRFHPLRALRAALAAPEPRRRGSHETILASRRAAAEQRRRDPWR